jgi:hypothetical protein
MESAEGSDKRSCQAHEFIEHFFVGGRNTNRCAVEKMFLFHTLHPTLAHSEGKSKVLGGGNYTDELVDLPANKTPKPYRDGFCG